MKIEMNMPTPPEGFEYTGEYQRTQPGDYALILGVDSFIPHQFSNSSFDPLPILRKKLRIQIVFTETADSPRTVKMGDYYNSPSSTQFYGPAVCDYPNGGTYRIFTREEKQV